jgi:hypothetical protein
MRAGKAKAFDAKSAKERRERRNASGLAARLYPKKMAGNG